MFDPSTPDAYRDSEHGTTLARRILVEDFRDLARRFLECERGQLHQDAQEHDLRDLAGQLVIQAVSSGFIRDPEIGRAVEHYTAPQENLGNRECMEKRDSRNLFLALTGQTSIQVYPDGRIDNSTSDGILPSLLGNAGQLNLELRPGADEREQNRFHARMQFSHLRRCVTLCQALAELLEQETPRDDSPASRLSENEGHPSRPHFDDETGDLSYGGQVLRRFNRSAKNCRLVLNSFQEGKWGHRIDDPLPKGRNDQRLHDTVKRLNESLAVIRFAAGGDGQSFIWEAVQ
jgi:hypothetical protein